MNDTEKAIRAGLTEAEITEAIREPMTIHLLSAVDIVATIATLRAELAARTEDLEKVRGALACAAETLEAIGDPVVGGEPRATLAICEHLARQRLAAIRPFLGAP